MRTCVVGAGAIGGWVAARLALAGEEVMALTGRGPIDGLEITEAGETQRAEFARFEGPADLLVIAVKATALGGITESVRPLIGPETIILPMLNGVPWWFVDTSGAGDNPLEPWIEMRLGQLEDVLAKRDWLAGDRFTVADLIMADVLRVPKVRAFGDRPASEDYVAKITARPAFRAAYDEQIAHFAAADAARA